MFPGRRLEESRSGTRRFLYDEMHPAAFTAYFLGGEDINSGAAVGPLRLAQDKEKKMNRYGK